MTITQQQRDLATSAPPAPDEPRDALIAIKMVGMFAIPCVGPLALAWVIAEASEAFAPFGGVDSIPAPCDTTPATTTAGSVIAPPGVVAGAMTWPTVEGTASGRRYPFVVDRTDQVWWPGLDGTGYHGRWGPAVGSDPNGRRSGMRVPPFLRML